MIWQYKVRVGTFYCWRVVMFSTYMKDLPPSKLKGMIFESVNGLYQLQLETVAIPFCPAVRDQWWLGSQLLPDGPERGNWCMCALCCNYGVPIHAYPKPWLLVFPRLICAFTKASCKDCLYNIKKVARSALEVVTRISCWDTTLMSRPVLICCSDDCIATGWDALDH